MDNKIRKTGSVQQLDKEGNVINNLSLDNLQPEYAVVLEDTLAFYKAHFEANIHSIYIRGSVAKGTAIHHIADLDTMAISYTEVSKKELEVRSSFRQEMSAKYPYLNGVEIFFAPLDSVNSSEQLQFLLQTQCICVHGKDIRKELPKFGIGDWAYAH